MTYEMGIVNKIITVTVLFTVAVLLVSLAQAGENVSVTDIEIYYNDEVYDCILDIENPGDENVTVSVGLFVDSVKIAEENVSLNIRYFKGFQINTRENIKFELPYDVGYHNVEIHLHNGDSEEVYDGYDYEVYEEEEEEVLVVEDWLKCP
jgi:hypothetical protein